MIEDWARGARQRARFDVLLEIGIPGQRTGCRRLEEALALARRLRASPRCTWAASKCYEGGAPVATATHDAREVHGAGAALEASRGCDAQNLFGDEVMLDGRRLRGVRPGGAAAAAQGLSRPVLGVLRSGCYVTHDNGNYARFLKQVEQREGLDASLRAALEVWAMVQSVPEPGLALLTCGRRDLSYDLEMPVPVRPRRAARAWRPMRRPTGPSAR